MRKSLGDYNVEKSSSHNIQNIVWTIKHSIDAEKLKNKKKNTDKKARTSSPTNIIYHNTPKLKSHDGNFFKIKEITGAEKLKNKKKNTDKKARTSSPTNCNIKQGFKRPGR